MIAVFLTRLWEQELKLRRSGTPRAFTNTYGKYADWHPYISKRISVEQHGKLTVTGGYEPKLIIIIPCCLWQCHIGTELKL